MIIFSLPGIYDRFSLNTNINDLKNFYPEKFISGFRFGTVYGTFPNMIWNGGLNLIGTMTSRDIRDIVRAYNEQNVRIRVSCTNSLIDDCKMHDRLCNIVLSELEANKSNSIEVEEDSMSGCVLSRTHPDVYQEVISDDISRFPSLLEKYYKVVADPSLNQDLSVYDQIDPQIRHRVEIPLNPYCEPGCDCREFCQSQIHSKQVRYIRSQQIMCDKWNRSFNDLADSSIFFIDRVKMQDLVKKGFTNLRILDNGNIQDLVDAYSYYFAKQPTDGLELRRAFEGWCGIR